MTVLVALLWGRSGPQGAARVHAHVVHACMHACRALAAHSTPTYAACLACECSCVCVQELLKERAASTAQVVERFQQLAIKHAETEKQLQREKAARVKLQRAAKAGTGTRDDTCDARMHAWQRLSAGGQSL